MYKNIQKTMTRLYENINKSLKFFWPSIKGGYRFPSESLITAEIIRLLSENSDTYFYPESYIGGQKRDLLIIDSKEKNIIQIEVKHLYQYERILADLERISNNEDIDEFLKATSKIKDILDYSRFGLFVGFGQNNDYNWWIAPTGEENYKKAVEYFNGKFPEEHLKLMMKYYNYPGATWSQIAMNEKEENGVWLCYYFTPLSK